MTILDSKNEQDKAILAECPIKLNDFLPEKSKDRHDLVKRTLKKLNVPFEENLNLVRGLDYYNDLCFEIKFVGEKGMTKDTLLGGGRYDYLFN